jgi:prophage regulatory protein
MTVKPGPVRSEVLLRSLGVSPDEVVGVAEIAKALGVTKRTAIRYSQRPDFPAPLATLSSGRVWRRDDVEAWAKRTLPLPRTGRPRKEPK